MNNSRAHVFVSGTVHGVYFRANTREEARNRGISGWVKNLNDGRVEAVFEGEEPAIKEMIEWCHEGSPRATVEDVAVEWDDPTGEFDEFTIRY